MLKFKNKKEMAMYFEIADNLSQQIKQRTANDYSVDRLQIL